MKSVMSSVEVEVPAAMAYRAFTNATSLREWLCDAATVEAHPRGRMYLWWRGDFYSSGHYLEVDKDRSVRFRWYSSIDPAPTEVQVAFDGNGSSTRVTLEHFIPDDPAWEEMAGTFRSNWDDSLENLKSVLESGIDLRIANRPMVGFIPGDFTPEQAARLGLPVAEGIRLDGVVDGMGAQRAGLQKDDVIVGLNGVTVTNDFSTFIQGLAGKKGGDPVEVVFYRGPEKSTITMELTRRPMLAVPFDAAELARQGREKYDAALADLEMCFAGVGDEAASTRPEPGEWNALEVVAHIMHQQRFELLYIAELVNGEERVSDGFGDNLDSQVEATAATYPTVEAMLGEYRRTVDELLRFVEKLPAEFVANKGSFYRVGQFILQPEIHINAHISQIKAAIATALPV
ncbi:MAG: SRPBCC domain-containing protein [Chloroflexota bacterium]